MRKIWKASILLAALLALAAGARAQGGEGSPTNINAQQLTLLPQAPVATVNTVQTAPSIQGPTVYYYWFVSHAGGVTSPPSGPFPTPPSPSTLGGINTISVTWTPAPGVATYDVLRTTTSATPTGACGCAVVTATATTTLTDNTPTASLGAYTVATSPSQIPAILTNTSQAIANASITDGTISPLSFGGKWDWKFVYDATITSGSKSITCPANDCNFTNADIGKQIFGTLIQGIGSAAGYLPGSAILTGSPLPTITSIVNANSIIVSANASSNCTASTSQLCGLAWGTQDETTALNAAMIAAWQNPGQCLAVQFPSGGALITGQTLFLSGPNLNSACGGWPSGTSQESGIDTTQTGPEVFGQGPGNSILIPSPNFNFASCTGGATANVCIGGTPNLEAHDFGINGLANQVNTPESVILFQLPGSAGGAGCTGSTGFNLTFSGWAANASGSVGFDMGSNACGDPTYSNDISESFGATNCKINSPGASVLTTTVYALACFGSTTQSLIVNLSQGNVDTNGSFFGSLTNPGPIVTIQNGGASGQSSTWNSQGDSFKFTNNTASNGTVFNFATGGAGLDIANFNGMQAFLPSTTTSASQVFLGASGANALIHCQKCVVIGTGTNNKIFNLGTSNTFFNDGGNLFANGSVASIFSGGKFGAPSERGTGTCSTNAATITFTGSDLLSGAAGYVLAPTVDVNDTTSASTGAQVTATTTTTATVHCNGASDTFNYTVYPNPF